MQTFRGNSARCTFRRVHQDWIAWAIFRISGVSYSSILYHCRYLTSCFFVFAKLILLLDIQALITSQWPQVKLRNRVKLCRMLFVACFTGWQPSSYLGHFVLGSWSHTMIQTCCLLSPMRTLAQARRLTLSLCGIFTYPSCRILWMPWSWQLYSPQETATSFVRVGRFSGWLWKEKCPVF